MIHPVKETYDDEKNTRRTSEGWVEEKKNSKEIVWTEEKEKKKKNGTVVVSLQYAHKVGAVCAVLVSCWGWRRPEENRKWKIQNKNAEENIFVYTKHEPENESSEEREIRNISDSC